MTSPLSSDELQFPSVPEAEFPAVPETGIPEDADTVEMILAGQRALGRLYSLLDAASSSESRLFVQLLRRDWDRRLTDLSRGGNRVLEGLKGKAEERLLPTAEALAGIAAEQATTPPRALAEVLKAFAERVLICPQIVPWKSEKRAVFEHFRASLEAEDAHLSLLELLRSLLPDPS